MQHQKELEEAVSTLVPSVESYAAGGMQYSLLLQKS